MNVKTNTPSPLGDSVAKLVAKQKQTPNALHPGAMGFSEADLKRFWVKVNKDGPIVRPELGKCWVWTASLNNKGYGKFGIRQMNWRGAHRISYLIAGGSIPEGAFVCHHCDNRKCVNPSHLFLGTAFDNNMDSLRKQRRVVPRCRGERAWNVKLTTAAVMEIRTTKSNKLMAAKYGVAIGTIKDVKNRTWQHLK